ncbi:MAG: TatD family hydrolase, partial [Thermomicrobiales bacterium]
HLDDSSFVEDYDTVISESVQAGVRGWINVGFEPDRWQSSIALAQRTEGIAVMLGVHPSSANQWSSSTADALRSLLGNYGAVAIGEIGLDFLRQEAPTPDVQTRAFNEQLDLAIELALPAVIHMRESEQAMLQLLTQRTSLPPLLFHRYDGGPALTDYVLKSGTHIGVGDLATRKGSERLRQQLLRIPLSQIVLETDSPYLMPARMRGRSNTPASVRAIATFLAGLKSEDEHHIASITTQNAFAFFGKLRTA